MLKWRKEVTKKYRFKGDYPKTIYQFGPNLTSPDARFLFASVSVFTDIDRIYRIQRQILT